MAESETPIEFLGADLAPGDEKSRALKVEEFEIARVQPGGDPLFDFAYERLWNEFGAHWEIEQREVLAKRLSWRPAAVVADCWMRYELLVVRRQGDFVAARDQTAVVMGRGRSALAVVHLSHLLLDPAWRRTGLAGWLRAVPIQTARACLAAAGQSIDSPIILVAEMEHPDPQFPSRMIRLKAYEHAGFKKIDPTCVDYLQPDFRPPLDIDAGGGPRPLRFSLIVRRVGREEEKSLTGQEVRHIVESLYRMYGSGFREADLAPLWSQLRDYPSAESQIALVPPTR